MPGAGDLCPYRTAPKALILMGDWCGPTVPTPTDENRGASTRDHTFGEGGKENK